MSSVLLSRRFLVFCVSLVLLLSGTHLRDIDSQHPLCYFAFRVCHLAHWPSLEYGTENIVRTSCGACLCPRDSFACPRLPPRAANTHSGAKQLRAATRSRKYLFHETLLRAGQKCPSTFGLVLSLQPQMAGRSPPSTAHIVRVCLPECSVRSSFAKGRD